MKLTYSLAKAAARDAGDRHMRRNYRIAWNEDDFNAACDELDRLLPKILSEDVREPVDTTPQKCENTHNTTEDGGNK